MEERVEEVIHREQDKDKLDMGKHKDTDMEDSNKMEEEDKDITN